MAQPELLEAVAEDAELSGPGKSDEREVSRQRKGVSVAEAAAGDGGKDAVEAAD